MGVAERSVVIDEDRLSKERYSIAIGYLRAFITLLVVAHHAMLAYHQFAPPAAPASLVPEPRWWQVFPIVDSARWPGFTLLAAFNDTFFMSLMFLLSGLFVWPSLRRKGSGAFLRDRGRRLGVPFFAAAAVLAPLAYYPTYLTSTATPSLPEFWKQWLSLGIWPAGPAWFLWVLLLFGAAAAAIFTVKPGTPGGAVPRLGNRPWLCFALLAGASAVVYVPMLLAVGPMHWTAVGPFTVQTSRVLHYALYFGTGVVVGASAPERGLLAPDGRLARRWLAWTLMALVTFGFGLTAVVAGMKNSDAPLLWGTLGGLAFALSCAATSFCLLAVFLRFARRSVRLLDSLRNSSYGIYLVHYAAVTWLQYVLLSSALSGLAKGTLVFVASVSASWLLMAALRRVRAVAFIS